MSVDKMSVDKMSVDKMSVDKMSVDKMCKIIFHARNIFESKGKSYMVKTPYVTTQR